MKVEWINVIRDIYGRITFSFSFFSNLALWLIFLIMLNTALVLVVLPNLIYAQENVKLHQKTLYEITKHNPDQNPSIKVGKQPIAIAVDPFTDTVYVANFDDNSVSAISRLNNTEIGRIAVGDRPNAISVDPFTSKIYVANYGDNSVSVINGLNNTEISRIKVGDIPNSILFDPDTHALYVTNYGDNSVSVINGLNNTEISRIKVGDRPDAIGLFKNTVYVANYGDNSVSVINGLNNTEISRIKVGQGPTDIGLFNNKLYVTNYGDNSVSVINGLNNTEISRIKVGDRPSAVGVDQNTSRLYVANFDDNSVSVINATHYNNTKIGSIAVGHGPSAVGVDPYTHTVYVANFDDNSVSLIDEESEKVVTGVTFNIDPFNSGHIECDKDKKIIVPIKQLFYLWAGSECTAKPFQGFEFVSWQENLKGNSTQFLNFSPPSSAWDSILDFFHMRPDNPEAALNITKFGSFTANFKELPPPIPSEFLLGLFSIVAITIVGWSIPSIISWAKSKRQARVVYEYHQRINKLGTIDEGDVRSLNELNSDIANDYSKGKISDKQYENMKNEISVLYQELHKKNIDSSNQSPEKFDVKELNNILSEVEDAYAKGKLNELHFTLLKDRIAQYKSIRKDSTE
jgi:YVTN family beta-propeller protein